MRAAGVSYPSAEAGWMMVWQIQKRKINKKNKK